MLSGFRRPGVIQSRGARLGPWCNDMWDILYYLVIVTFVAAAVVAGAFAARAYMSGTPPLEAFAALFGPRPEPRLDVVEQSNIDGRRRLILIRRDDVEHLIMTGGPVDMVIETGIGPRPARAPEVVEAPAPVLARAPRMKGQAVGEQ
jgi:hypothetical protein